MIDPDVQAALAAIDTYRLARDLSWPQLEVEMTAAGAGIPARTLHYLCKRVHIDNANIRDRTVSKLRRFIAAKRIPVSPRRRAAAQAHA